MNYMNYIKEGDIEGLRLKLEKDSNVECSFEEAESVFHRVRNRLAFFGQFTPEEGKESKEWLENNGYSTNIF